MTAGYISGQCMLRPVRMGLVIPPGDFDALCKAIELATSSWGGQGFPIFEAGVHDQRALQLATALGVDCLYSVSTDEASVTLSSAAGLSGRRALTVYLPSTVTRTLM